MTNWPIVGRERARARLRAGFRVPGSSFLLTGPAGVGKSRVVAQALDDAPEVRAARLRAGPTMRESPYEGLSFLAPEVVAAAASDRLGMVQRALDHWTIDPPDVVWVDDVPNADDDTLVVLFHVVSQRLSTLVMTARDGEPLPRMVAALAAEGGLDTLIVEPLDRDEVDLVLVRALDGPVDRVTVSRLHDRSGGNPLLLRELVRASLADRSLHTVRGAWQWDADGARGDVADLTLRHAAELPPGALRLLECLAIAGSLPAPAARMIEDDEAIDELVASGIVTVDAEVLNPAHPLFVEGALARATPASRTSALRGLLHVLGPGAQAPVDRLRTIRWRREIDDPMTPGELVAATSTALGVFDTATAIDVGTAALAAGRDDVAIPLAMALTYAGELDAAAPVLDRAVETATDDGTRVFAAITRSLNLAYRDGFTPQIAEQHGQLLATLTDPDLETLVRSERASALAFSAQLRAAIELSRPYVVEGQAAPWDALAYVPAFGAASSTLGRTASVLDALAKLEPAAAPYVGRHVAWFHAFTAQAALLHGELGRADAAIAAFDRVAHLAMVPGVAAVLHAETLGIIAMWRGDLSVAVRRLTEAVARSDVPEAAFRRVIPLAHLAMARALTGDAREARRCADEAMAHSHRFLLGLGYALQADAWAVAAAGDHTGAARAATAAAHRCLEHELVSPAMWCLADALRFAPSPGTATQLVEVASQVDGAWASAFGAWASAVVTKRAAEAIKAAEELTEIGAVVHAADAAALASSLWLAEGRTSSTRAASFRSWSLREEAEGLRWRSEPTPADLGTGPAGAVGAASSHDRRATLTRREREVAALAAAGASNLEIASALRISSRTVEGHLHRAMAKMGVSRRDALPVDEH